MLFIFLFIFKYSSIPFFTLAGTNIAPQNMPSPKDMSLQPIDFRVL